MAQKLYKPLLIDSIKAQIDLPKQRFVGFDGNLCGVNKKSLGVCDVETEKNQFAPVGVLGILLVESGSAITQGAKITSDAQGRAIPVTASEEVNGYALDAATASGEIIRIARGI